MLCTLSLFASLSLAEERVALVIGNSSYAQSPLKNSANDATDMAAKLAELGFEVLKYTDVNRQNMRMAMRDFGHKLKSADVGLFYFAGHGVQIEGINYLVPLDTDINSVDEVQDESIDASAILRKMQSAGNKVNIVILDACRNNPFPSSFRSLDRGLARMDGPIGSFIAYATSPGSVAADGDGRNGLYTQYLLAALSQPGLSIEQVFKQVRNRVVHDTHGKQTPWESSSLMGEFTFSAAKIAENRMPVAPMPIVQPEVLGHIQVISNVANANVAINQVHRGKVAANGVLNIRHVRGKQAKVTVSAKGYLPYTREIKLLSNQWQQVNVTLRETQQQCYAGKKVVLNTQMELLGADEHLTAIQKNQLSLLITDALTQNKLNALEPNQLAKLSVQAYVSVHEVPVTAIKTSFKTVDIAIVLKLIDSKNGGTLSQISMAYRKAGANAEEILRNVLHTEMEEVVHTLLAKACA